MTLVFNRVSETPKRKSLRHSMPESEVILWSKLQRRQVDGDSHFQMGAEQRDAERETFIKQYGIKFLRFTNSDVRENLYGVLTQIWETAKELKPK